MVCGYKTKFIMVFLMYCAFLHTVFLTFSAFFPGLPSVFSDHMSKGRWFHPPHQKAVYKQHRTSLFLQRG